LLGAGVLLAPIGWSVHFALSYGLVYPAFDWQSKASLHAVSVVAALLALGSFALGWRGLRRSSLGASVDSAQRDRVHFLASLACGAGLFFLLAVIAQSIPTLMLPLRGHP
jgi:hypothetical protein